MRRLTKGLLGTLALGAGGFICGCESTGGSPTVGWERPGTRPVAARDRAPSPTVMTTPQPQGVQVASGRTARAGGQAQPGTVYAAARAESLPGTAERDHSLLPKIESPWASDAVPAHMARPTAPAVTVTKEHFKPVQPVQSAQPVITMVPTPPPKPTTPAIAAFDENLPTIQGSATASTPAPVQQVSRPAPVEPPAKPAAAVQAPTRLPDPVEPPTPPAMVKPITPPPVANNGNAAQPLQHAKDYTSLTGEVQFLRTRGTWRLRYAPADQEDRYGGTVTLTGDGLPPDCENGQIVRVQGYLTDPDSREPRPLYWVQKFEVVRAAE